MGIETGSFLASLYLYDYKVDLISNVINRAIKFKSSSRFIDSKCNLNDSGLFCKSFHGIYPNELLRATFHDLDITVVDGIHNIHLSSILSCSYAKHKSYHFCIRF